MEGQKRTCWSQVNLWMEKSLERDQQLLKAPKLISFFVWFALNSTWRTIFTGYTFLSLSLGCTLRQLKKHNSAANLKPHFHELCKHGFKMDYLLKPASQHGLTLPVRMLFTRVGLPCCTPISLTFMLENVLYVLSNLKTLNIPSKGCYFCFSFCFLKHYGNPSDFWITCKETS